MIIIYEARFHRSDDTVPNSRIESIQTYPHVDMYWSFVINLHDTHDALEPNI